MQYHLFPGQGSQKVGMGAELFDKFPDEMALADEIVGYSLRRLCLEDPDDQLNNTQFTQPALYVVSALTYENHLREGGQRPDFVAGHSLGEYNALLAAGVFDFATGLRLVKRRGELMGQASGGGMAAVIGLDEDSIRRVLSQPGLDRIDVANLNSPTQTVISGLRDDVVSAEQAFRDAGAANYAVLNVSGAFHSRYMAGAQQAYALALEGIDWAEPTVPVVSNVSARPFLAGRISEGLLAQIASPVKWSESMRFLMGRGDGEFVQMGPGRVLASLMRSIRRDATPLVLSAREEAELTAGLPAERPSAAVPSKTPGQSTGRNVPISATASSFGSSSFKEDYGLRLACLAGGMYRGISSRELVIAMGRDGMLGFLGTAGLEPARLAEDLTWLTEQSRQQIPFGVNLVHEPDRPAREQQVVDLALRFGVRALEASAFISLSDSLIHYRLTGIHRAADGTVVAPNRIIGKVSRPEVAAAFLSPSPQEVVERLLGAGKISAEEAELAGSVPVAHDLCVEADSGGHTDQGVSFALFPAIQRLRDDMATHHGYGHRVRIGMAGGIGTPHAVMAAFMMGADFVMTGSVNQCTPEAGASDDVKELLAEINIQDTAYAPAGDMFELGARVQVLRKGVLFPARANRLYEVYRQASSLDDIDARTAQQIQERYFGKSFDEVFRDIEEYKSAQEIRRAEEDPKHRMAMVFKWYFARTSRFALEGRSENRVDYQVHCGPALGALNQWARGTDLESWRDRSVGRLNRTLLETAAEATTRRFADVGTP